MDAFKKLGDEKMDETMEINLKEMLYAWLRKLWLILLCALIAGGAAYAYTVKCVTPLYQASVTFYVNNYEVRNDNQTISSSDLATAQRLVLTYVNIIKSNTVLEKVAQESGLDFTASQLRGMMTAESIDDTELFRMQISYKDPYMAAQIANAVAAVAPNEIANILEGSSTKVVDYAKVPASPYTPNYTRNTLIGVAIGAVAAMVLITLQVLMDVRIKSEEDLLKICDAPVLGVIPNFREDAQMEQEFDENKRKKANSKAVV